MTGQRLLAAAALAACALIAGCGQVGTPSTGGTGPATRATGTASGPAAPASSSPACQSGTGAAAGSTNGVRLTNADNGQTICLMRGTKFFVFLRGTAARLWKPIQASSPDVARRASGVLSLMVGETGAYFQAVRDGTVTLTSTRSPCHADSSAQPGTTATCTVLLSFRVTVVITG